MRGLGFLVMLVLALGIGAASASRQGLPWRPDVEAVRLRLERAKNLKAREAEFEARGITLAEFRAAIERGAVLIDARDPEAFAAEHLRLDREPPVLNIFPDHGLENHFERLHQLAGLELVLFCNSRTCDLAEELLVELENAGLADQFADIRIFFDGWEAIAKTDLPRATGPDTWTGEAGLAAEPNEGLTPDPAGSTDADTDAESEADGSAGEPQAAEEQP